MNKTLIGVVTSNKMIKTVIVKTERKLRHPFYKKIITRHKSYKVHNESFDLKDGDVVKIKETRPISKEKYFEVIEKLN